MTDEIIDSGIQAEPEPKVGPGRNLREMREARHLTQEAVSTVLGSMIPASRTPRSINFCSNPCILLALAFGICFTIFSFRLDFVCQKSAS